jgi:hypothetical protein
MRLRPAILETTQITNGLPLRRYLETAGVKRGKGKQKEELY